MTAEGDALYERVLSASAPATAPVPAQGAPLLIDDQGRVTYAPEWVQFSMDWLAQAAAARAVTVVGLDVVVHASNGDFHYRHEADGQGAARVVDRQIRRDRCPVRRRFVTRWWWKVTSHVDFDQWNAEVRDAGDGCSDCGCTLDDHRVGGCVSCELCDGYV